MRYALQDYYTYALAIFSTLVLVGATSLDLASPNAGVRSTALPFNSSDVKKGDHPYLRRLLKVADPFTPKAQVKTSFLERNPLCKIILLCEARARAV